MRRGALLALIAWQLVLAESVQEIQRFDVVDPDALSNVELLVPLMVQASAVGDRYDRARYDDDEEDSSFSSIPASAFIIDDDTRVSDDASSASPTHHTTQLRSSREPDPAYRPRSLYLDNLESTEHVEQVERGAVIWRACTRLARAVHSRYLLKLLCAELLDGVLPPPAPPAYTPQCDCCRQVADPPWFGPVRSRRDFIPLGENSDMVLRYMHAPHRRPPSQWTQK